MKIKRFIAASGLAGLMACGGGALADAPRLQPLLNPPPVVIHNWGKDNPACAEWSNACTICKRNEAGVAACSTPGIACQPKEISCSRQVEKKT